MFGTILKSSWLFFSCFVVVLLGIGNAIQNNPEGTFEINDTDIDFYLYDSSNPSIPIHINDTDSIHGSSFSASKDTVFVTHGFTESFTDCTGIKDAFLKKHDVNVIIVDWSKCTFTAYIELTAVGNIVSSFIKNMVEENGLQLDRTTLVGFSLGAHIMGITGKDLGGLCGQVVGLDPEGVGFYVIKASERLNTSSGQFVQVIHTNGNQFGFYQPLGHADYYPNGGKKQPGCEWDIIGLCDHLRSMRYFEESVSSGHFRALKCEDYSQSEKKDCLGDVSIMGGFPLDKRASGIYFLDTNRASPFAKG